MTEELKHKAEEKYCKNCKLRQGQCLWAWRQTNGLDKPNEENCSCKEVPAYIAGATENGIQWHKVADGDLPKNNTDCVVVKEYEGTRGKYTRKKLSVYANGGFLIWNHEYDSYVKLHNIIAWCEIPKE